MGCIHCRARRLRALDVVLRPIRKWSPEEVRRTFSGGYNFLVHKWWFDELYAFLFVRPVLRISDWVAAIDKKGIDWLADNAARTVEAVSRIDDWIDRVFINPPVNLTARWTYGLGLRCGRSRPETSARTSVDRGRRRRIVCVHELVRRYI